MKKLFLSIIILSITQLGYGQLEVGLPQMKHLWQSNWLNPGITPEKDLIIVLPGLYFGFHHSGEPFKDVWKVENRTLVLDLNTWVGNLDDNNDVFTRFELPTISVAKKFGAMTWSVGHSFRNQANVQYPRELIELIHYGNAPYIGETLDLGTSVNWTSYSDFNVGLAYQIGIISVGARAHFLNGIQYLETERNDISLHTDEDIYQLTFATDMLLRSSSFLTAEDLDALSFEFTGLETYEWFSRNKGFSLDLGASVEFFDRLTAELSILDLGSIKWKDVKEYTSNGSYTYEGVEVENLADFDSLSFDETLDTIGKILGVEETDGENFRQTLNSRLYLGLHFMLTDDLRLSGVYTNETFGDKSYSGYGLGAQYDPIPWWSIGTMVSSRYDQWAWGLNTSVRIGFVELYLQSENILSVVNLNDLGNGSGRVGLNLVFGGGDEED